MKKAKPKGIILVLLVCICFVFWVVPTWAWRTTGDSAVNDFTMADLTGSIEEEVDPPGDLEKGTPHKKEVAVRNTSGQSAFIRVMLSPQIIGSDGNLLDDTGILDLGLQLNDPSSGNPLWINGGDGYYYYVEAVPPGQSTSQLMNEVTLDGQTDEEYDDAKVDIHVIAEFCTVSGSYPHRKAWWEGNTPTSDPLREIDQLLAAQI